MKGIQSNGFLPIIAQASAEMDELHGEVAGINDIMLGEDLSGKAAPAKSKWIL